MVQRSLMPPDCPSCPKTMVAAGNRMVGDLGGDFYDFTVTPKGTRGFLIGDVTGHGVNAALVMSLIYGLLRGVAGAFSSPGDALLHVSTVLTDLNDRERLPGLGAPFSCTAFYGMFDPATGMLRYASAGHPPPLLRRSLNASIEQLETTGAPLGYFRDAPMEEREVVLLAADRLLLYTDGLTECRNGEGRFFGQEAVESILSAPHPSCQALVDHLFAVLDDFGDGASFKDDVTLVAIEYLG